MLRCFVCSASPCRARSFTSQLRNQLPMNASAVKHLTGSCAHAQNLEPGVPHTLHIVVKPSAPGSTPPASSSRPQPLGSATAAANTDGPQGLGDPNEHMLPNSMLPMELNSSAHPAAAVTGSNPSAEGLSAGQYPPDGAAAGAEQPPPPVSAPIQVPHILTHPYHCNACILTK